MSTSIVLGLGNPGTRYRKTRHNLGFRVVRELSRRFRCDALEVPSAGPVLELLRARPHAAGAIYLATPSTFMNRAGSAAVWLLERFLVAPSRLIVVYDDADLALGRVRIRRRGGSGGHRGIRSIIEHLGTEEFPRVKLGVRGKGRGETDLAEYVLGEFDPDEEAPAEVLVGVGSDAVQTVIAEGVEAAMGRFNTTPERGEGEEREQGLERTGPAGRPDPEWSEG